MADEIIENVVVADRKVLAGIRGLTVRHSFNRETIGSI